VSDRRPFDEKEDDFVRFEGFEIQELNPESPETAPAGEAPSGEPTPPEDTLPPSGEPTLESVLTDQIQGETSAPQEETPLSPASFDSPELVLVHKLCTALAKAVKAVQLYPADNPVCAKFAQELMSRIQDTFQALDLIRLSVGKTKLFFAGEAVLQQEGREESVPGRLFWAGVREISFHVGLTGQEALAFLDSFRMRAGEDEETDIVSRLWEARFEHITYIAIDDILDLENESDPVPEEVGREFMNYVDLDMHDLEDGEGADRVATEMAERIRAKFNAEDVSLFGVTEAERSALAAEIEEEESATRMLRDVLHIISEVLYLDTNEGSFVDLVHVLSGALVALIGEGRLAEAAEVVLILGEMRDEGGDLSPAKRSAIDSGLASAYDAPRRASLTQHLDTSRRDALETLDLFVGVLPDEAIGPLCDVLGNLHTLAARRRLVQALAVKAHGDVRPFLPFLRDPRTELVRHVAGILGQSRNEAALEPLRKLFRHPDFHVRREGLAALSKLGTGRALGVLADALLDVDPRIRMTAARSLGMAGRTSIPALLTSIEDPEFDDRPLTEKRAFYEALGFAGGESVLPVLKRALKRKRWFRRTQADEIRACACEALGWVGGAEARALLSTFLEDRSILVRTAAQSGLRRIARGGGDDLLKEAA
jgi:hypothetical protein